MPKPLNYYCSNLLDQEPFSELALLLEQDRDRDFKLEIALTALHLAVYPNISPTYMPHLADAARIVRRLSNAGQISLARALLEDVQSEG